MKVVLLAGGFGTRISEESQFKPKPMLEIGGKPRLWHIMKEYSYYGFNEFIICAGYKQHVIKEWFANLGENLTTERVGALMHTNVMKAIYKVWDPVQVDDFDEAFASEVNHRCRMIASAERHRLNMVISELERATNAMQQMTSMFDGVDAADMTNVMKKLSTIDDTALVEAVIAAGRDAK